MCINVISSSGRFAIPPLFGELEQRGVGLRQQTESARLGWGVVSAVLNNIIHVALQTNG